MIRDVDLTVGAGRGGRPARRERRGQDDDAARRLRPRQADEPAGSCSTATTSRGRRRAPARGSGSPTCPEGRGLFFGLTVAEHFRVGAARGAPRRGARLRVLPEAGGAEGAARRPAVGRRAADARGRPRARAAAEAAAARRAQPRARAGDRRAAAAGRARRSRASAAARCCSSSSTSTWRSRSPTAATSCRTARSCSRTTREHLRANRQLLVASYLGEHTQDAAAAERRRP